MINSFVSPLSRSRPLKPVKRLAARLLVEGRTMTCVARVIGVHRYTISRWQADPGFQEEVRRQVEGAALRLSPSPGAAPRRQNQKELPRGRTP